MQGDEEPDRTPNCVGVLPLPSRPEPARSETPGRQDAIRHPDSRRARRADLPAQAVAGPALMLTPYL
jgi:hypothetical protein